MLRIKCFISGVQEQKMSNNKATPLPAYTPGPPPMAAPPTYAQAVGGVPPTSPFTPTQTRNNQKLSLKFALF